MSYTVQRREEERERRRQEILAAAESLYSEVGWEAVTMDRIARSARLSRALLSVSFRDKDDVLLGISELAMRDLYRRFVEASATHVTGLDKVEAMGRGYVAWALDAPHRFDACARFQARPGSTDGALDPNLAACQAVGDSVLTVLATAIGTGLADGTISPAVGDPATICRGLQRLASTLPRAWQIQRRTRKMPRHYWRKFWRIIPTMAPFFSACCFNRYLPDALIWRGMPPLI